MKWTRTVETEVRVSPWVILSGDPLWDSRNIHAMRIWIQTDGFSWWQMHEWEKAGGNREREAEGWIRGSKGFPSHFIEPDELPPTSKPYR